MAGSTDPAVAFLASPLAKFRPWRTKEGHSPQADFLRAVGSHKVVVYRAGNRSGKTVVGAVNVCLLGLGWHPYLRLPRDSAMWVVTLDWDTGVGQIIWPVMKQWIPKERTSISWMRRTGNEVPTSILFKDTGITLTFKSSESKREKFQGTSLSYAWIDEETDGQIVEETRARLLDLGGGLAVTLTPVARRLWVSDMEREKDENGRPRTKVIRASMRDAANAIIVDKNGVERPMLDRVEVDRLLRSLPDRQRKVRELGDFAAIEGLVYQDFARDVHVLHPKAGVLKKENGKEIAPWPLPPHWPRYASIDFGYTNPTAVLVYAKRPTDDKLFVYRCYYGAGITISKWAEELKRVLPELAEPMVADHDAMQRAELGDHDIATVAARKDIVQGIECVDRILMQREDGEPGIYFVREDSEDGPRFGLTGTRCDCDYLIWEMSGYRYPERKEGKPDPKDHPIKKDDHALDSLRYGVMALTHEGARAPQLPDREPTTAHLIDAVPPAPTGWQNPFPVGPIV